MTEPERYGDIERNKIINAAVMKLDRIINQHDPDIDAPIKDGVWDCLDRMAEKLEARAPSAK